MNMLKRVCCPFSLVSFLLLVLLSHVGCVSLSTHTGSQASQQPARPLPNQRNDEVEAVKNTRSSHSSDRSQQEGADSYLMWAAKNGDISAAKQALKGGANIDSQDTSGFTPLMWAAGKGNTSLVKLLLSNGADVNSTTSMGICPLVLAVMEGHDTVVQLLIANGADPNVMVHRQGKEMNAVEIAKVQGFTKIVDMLKEAGGQEERVALSGTTEKTIHGANVRVKYNFGEDSYVARAESGKPKIFFGKGSSCEAYFPMVDRSKIHSIGDNDTDRSNLFKGAVIVRAKEKNLYTSFFGQTFIGTTVDEPILDLQRALSEGRKYSDSEDHAKLKWEYEEELSDLILMKAFPSSTGVVPHWVQPTITLKTLPSIPKPATEAKYWIHDLKRLDHYLIATIAISEPTKQILNTESLGCTLSVDDQRGKVAAQWLLIQGEGTMRNVVAPVPLDTCNVIVDNTEVSIFGIVPITMEHGVVESMRYHDGILLIPVVFRTESNVNEVKSITICDHTIHK